MLFNNIMKRKTTIKALLTQFNRYHSFDRFTRGEKMKNHMYVLWSYQQLSGCWGILGSLQMYAFIYKFLQYFIGAFTKQNVILILKFQESGGFFSSLQTTHLMGSTLCSLTILYDYGM